MNRWDEIFATAHDVAAVLLPDGTEDDRAAVTDGLIRLSAQMIDAVGKGVAIEGEADTSSSEPDEANKAHCRYLIGEEIQDQSSYVLARVTEDSYLDRLERLRYWRRGDAS